MAASYEFRLDTKKYGKRRGHDRMAPGAADLLRNGLVGKGYTVTFSEKSHGDIPDYVLVGHLTTTNPRDIEADFDNAASPLGLPYKLKRPLGS